MIKRVFLVILFMMPLACTADNLKQDIALYVKNAELCEHLAGEAGDQEPAEAEELNKNINHYCGLAQKQLHALEKKYKDNKSAMQEIRKHKYDSVESYSVSK